MYSASISGMSAAQAGLAVTGHNISNSGMYGFSRQRTVQSDMTYKNFGVGQVGMGTSTGNIHQIRDKFLDMSYRSAVTEGNYYYTVGATGYEIENIFGEMNSMYGTQSVFSDVEDAIQELSLYSSGIETRGNFVGTCISLLNKAQNVDARLYQYQVELDQQVRQQVSEINALVSNIEVMNKKIVAAEASGANANDYRDQRNLYIDELSTYIPVEVNENSDGSVDISTQGNELLNDGYQTRIGLKYTDADSGFVEPVFTNSTAILPYDADPLSYRKLYTLTGVPDNNGGSLEATLICRGSKKGNHIPLGPAPNPNDLTLYPLGVNDPKYKQDKLLYDEDVFNNTQAFIPKIQREFDTLMFSVISLINDAVAPAVLNPATGLMVQDPNAPYDLNGNQSYTEIFVRKDGMPRFDANGNLIPEDPNDPTTWYTIDNIMINPLLLDSSGYDLICLSKSGAIDDTDVVLDMIDQWNTAFILFDDSTEPMTIEDAYQSIITEVANITSVSIQKAQVAETSITQVDSYRMSVSSVSMDEELTNMMKYQYAYEASSKMLTVLDGMMDKLINGTAV